MNTKLIMIVTAVLVALGGGYFISTQENKDDSGTQPVAQNEAKDTPSTGGATLDLTGQQLTELPESALSRTDITTLNVSNNQLTSLPASIAKLTNLEVLNVENNRLETLPKEIAQLKNLREIRANNNRIAMLPEELGSMSHLKLLDISGNNIPEEQIASIKSKLTDTEVKN